MSTMTINPTHSDEDVLAFIRRHLAAGEQVQVTAMEPFMSPQEVADSLDVSRTFIMNKLREGVITSSRRGTRHRISTAEVERFRRWYYEESAKALAVDF